MTDLLFVEARRRRFFQKMRPHSIAFLFGAAEESFLSCPFVQNRDFWYLCPYGEPGTILCLVKEEESIQKTILFNPPKDEKKEQWDGLRLGQTAAIEQLSVQEALSLDVWKEQLPNLLHNKAILYHQFGVTSQHDQTLLTAVQQLQASHRKAEARPLEWISWRPWMDNWRRVKDQHEIGCLRKAANISIDAMERVFASITACQHEYEIESLLVGHYLAVGGYKPSYLPIVGSGKNATILHYHQNGSKIASDELILIDAACSVDGYAADITRTIPAQGRFSEPQKEIYNIVLAAADSAIQHIRPGSNWNIVEEAARKELVMGLCSLGILSGTAEHLLATHADRPFYPHSIGHWLGLEVHDTGGYHDWQSEKPVTFVPGMVLTVEPGLYFPESVMTPASARYRNLGVRIEDMILVTEEGNEVLSIRLPRKIEEIEAACGDNRS